MGSDEIHEQLAWLARGPANSILTYQGYEINGYTFCTRAQDNKSTNQNSGVRIDVLSVETHRRAATGNTKSREVAGALAGTAPSSTARNSVTRPEIPDKVGRAT